MMYKLVILLLLSPFFNADTDDIIEINWNEERRLQWSDFRGQPDQSSDAAAVTASGISFSYSISKSSSQVINFTAEVGAHFYPAKSWFKEESVDAHILAHEQLHFDITELNVRKFRKRLSKIIPNEDLLVVLQKEQTRANEELANMQNKYDFESDYSIKGDIQNEWVQFVKSELETLHAFRSKS